MFLTNKNLKVSVLLALYASCVCVSADVAHLKTTEEPTGPANPYVFSYQAGRAPGHVDRQHTEVSDGSGVVRGAFSYVDPKNQVRTVQYVADENGFHPQLSHANEDVEAVKLAKQKHINLYNRIAHQHAHAQEHPHEGHPHDTDAVLRATQNHFNLYERIAADHAEIGAKREKERQVLEQQQQQQKLKQHYENDPYKIPVAVHYE